MPMIFHYFFAFFRIFKNFNQNIFIFLFFCATLSPKPVYVMNIWQWKTKGYTILFEGNEYPIIIPNIYSTEKFEKEFTYSGSDLGATYTPENS